jgi:hypothetical protein
MSGRVFLHVDAGFDPGEARDPGGKWAGELLKARSGEATRKLVPPELDGVPEPGKPFLMFRLGSEGEGHLTERNTGNSYGVAEHLAHVDDFDSPQGVGGSGSHINVFTATIRKPVGPYKPMIAHRGGGFEPGVGFRARGPSKPCAISLSFGKGGYDAQLLASIPLKEVRAALKARGYNSFDDSGWRIGGEVIREVALSHLGAATHDDQHVWVEAQHPRRARGPGGGEFTSGAGGETFASPNVRELPPMTSAHAMATAQAQIASRRHKLFQAAAEDVDLTVGISNKSEKSAIGAWKDGAESTTVMIAPAATPEQLRLSAAMKGWLGQQKAVLSFAANPAGKGIMYSGLATGSLDDIHRALLGNGLENHTLVPTANGAMVYIADTDGSLAQGVATYARSHKAKFRATPGDAEFIGAEHYEGTSDAEQRAEGRKAYEALIAAAGDRVGPAEWGRLRDRWAKALAETQDRAVRQAELSGQRLFHFHVGDQEVFVEAEHPRQIGSHFPGRFAPKGTGGQLSGVHITTPHEGPTTHVEVHPPAPKPTAPWTLEHGDPTGKSSWLAVAQEAAEKAVAAYKTQHPKSPAKGVGVRVDIERAMAAAAAAESWKTWYEDHRPLARELFGKQEPQFEKALAIASINNAPKQNVVVGVDLMTYLLSGGQFPDLPKGVSAVRWPTPPEFEKEYGYKLLPAWLVQLNNLQHGLPISGPKVSEFDKALSGDPTGTPIDRHMGRFLFEGYEGSGVSDVQHKVGKAIILAWAKQMRWEPRELQAVTWAASLAAQGKKTSNFRDELLAKAGAIRAFLGKHPEITLDALAAMYQPKGYVGLAKLAETYENLAGLLTLFETIHDRLGENPRPEDVAKLVGLELPTHDAQVYLHVHQGDAWEEREHPRKAKGPGGGEFTVKGSGSFGGGPTIHVHTEPEKLTPAAEEAEFNRRSERAERWQKSYEAKHRAEHEAFEQAVVEPKSELRRAGYLVRWVPVAAREWLGADDTPPKDPARMMAAARGFDMAVGVLRSKGLGALADKIKEEIGVAYSSLRAQGGATSFGAGEATQDLDQGVVMETVNNGEGDQFILINANSKPAQAHGVHAFTPMMAVEMSKMKDATPEQLASYEMRASAIHEFGHVLDILSETTMTATLGRELERELTGAWGENWTRHAGSWLQSNVSGYAATKPQEATAELFYMMVTRGVDALPKPLQKWGQYWFDLAKAEHLPPVRKIMADWE